jgi:hypothetical protein
LGRVVDDATKDHLAGAKVSLEAGGVPPMLYSDSEGVFAFPVPTGVRTARIRIELAGYEHYDRQVDLSSTDNVQEVRLHANGTKLTGVSVMPPTATTASTTPLPLPAPPAPSPNRQSIEGVTFTMQGCSRQGTTISCRFTVIEEQRDDRVLIWGSSRLIDRRGKEELASTVSLGGSSGKVGRYSSWSDDLVRGIPVAGGITFDAVDADQNQAALIELITSAGNIQFRDVPLSGS